jgi:hypothetical protein
MAVSEQITHGLLNAWPRVMGVNQWHFNQISGPGTFAPLAEPGDIIYVQPDRKNVADGLVRALAQGVPFLGTFHRPVYVTETVSIGGAWPGPYGRTIKTKYRHVQAIGRRGATLLEADAPVVYSDDGNGGGVNNIATITATVPSGTSADEIRLFFRQADSLANEAADPRWEIEPLISVEVSGTTVTIVGPRWLFVSPALWRQPYRSPNYNRSSINNGVTTNASDFVTEVDVYRIYPDATNAVTYKVGHVPYCTDCTFTEYTGTAYVKDGPRGLVQLCSDCANVPCYGYPQYVDIHYLAGFPLDPFTGLPDSAIESAFVQLANTKMPYEPADFSDEPLKRWLHDFERMPTSELTAEVIKNPFGIKRGQVEAFLTLNPYAYSGAGARF